MLPFRIRRLISTGACSLTLALSACSTKDAPLPASDTGDTAAPESDSRSADSSPSGGCGERSTYGAGTSQGQIAHAGKPRTFRVHVPPAYDATIPTPVVLMFHGGGGSGRQFEEASSEMDPVADRERFIAVYPDGTGVVRTWNGGGCCGAAVQNGEDDVGFVAALVEHLEGALCVDRRRMFASGMSNGAILSHRLACELSDRIAAVAPVAGTDMTMSCTPSRPVPVQQIHGNADGHVPWNGGEGCGPAGVAFTSVPETMTRWRARNGCEAASAVTFEAGDGRCETYEGCADGADVTLCTIAGGGHNWPGGKPPVGLVECPGNGIQSATFSASEAVWRFLSRHPMPAR